MQHNYQPFKQTWQIYFLNKWESNTGQKAKACCSAFSPLLFLEHQIKINTQETKAT